MALSLAKLREEGWTPEIAEHYNHFSRRRKDLFGAFDIIAVRADTPDVIVVQTTTKGHMKERETKIAESEYTAPFLDAIRKLGWTIHVHGWHRANKQWVCKIADLS
jgi:hypothetical protein